MYLICFAKKPQNLKLLNVRKFFDLESYFIILYPNLKGFKGGDRQIF